MFNDYANYVIVHFYSKRWVKESLHLQCQQNCSSSVVVVLEQDKLFTDGLCGQFGGLRNPSCWDKLHCAARGRATSQGSCAALLAQCPACGAVVWLAPCLVASLLSPGSGEKLADWCLIWAFPLPVARRAGCELGTAGRWWCTEEGHDLFGEASCPRAHPASLTHLLGQLPNVVKLEFKGWIINTTALVQVVKGWVKHNLAIVLPWQLQWHLKLMCYDCTSQSVYGMFCFMVEVV